MERFVGLEAFVAVVEAGSFTAAASAQGVSKSYMSKQVSALENRLGARLLNRTTRSLALTSAGRAFYDRCAQILAEVEDAERAVTQLQTEPRGLLRMSVPVSFGLKWIAPVVAEFLTLHDNLEIELDFTDRKVDLIDEGLDLVVRIGELADSSFAFRRLAPTRMLVCVSPAFLERRGTPTRPSDLSAEDFLQYSYQSSTSWTFVHGDEQSHVRPSGRLRANIGEAIAEACARGEGVGLLPDFVIAPYVRAGTLVHIFDDWIDNERRAVWALYPHSRHLSAKVRGFVDFLAERLDPCPWSDV